MVSLLILPALAKQLHGDLAEAEPVILHRCWTITLDQNITSPKRTSIQCRLFLVEMNSPKQCS